MYVLLGASNCVRMHSNFPIGNCVSLARSGATVSQVQNLPWLKGILEEYLKQYPRGCHKNDVILIVAGTNDMRKNVSHSDFKVHLKSLLRYCTKHFRKIVLGKIPPIPIECDCVNERIVFLNRWLESVAEGRPDLICVDTHRPFLEATSTVPCKLFFEKVYHNKFDKEGNPLVDLLHLNELGLFILKDLLLQAC